MSAELFFQAKLAFTTGPIELSTMLKEGRDIEVVDVRAAEDFAKGHVSGAVNAPKGSWDTTELSKEKHLIFYCYAQQCHLAARAAYHYARLGHAVMEMEGGWQAWEAMGLPST